MEDCIRVNHVETLFLHARIAISVLPSFIIAHILPFKIYISNVHDHAREKNHYFEIVYRVRAYNKMYSDHRMALTRFHALLFSCIFRPLLLLLSCGAYG